MSHWIMQLSCLSALGFCLLSLGSPTLTRGSEEARPLDSRHIYSGTAPSWLRAVGKLRVPGSTYRSGRRSHLLEDCSATLITHSERKAADTVITAWHCLANYNDLSKPILFTLVSGQKRPVQRQAHRIADGGGMHADWAILRLNRSIALSEAVGLRIHPGHADPALSISMAGFSRNTQLGDFGEQLTFDPACNITHVDHSVSDSNCLAQKGASGGAVVQLSGNGVPWLSGVISEGDSSGLSRFVPVGVFRGALRHHLGQATPAH